MPGCFDWIVQSLGSLLITDESYRLSSSAPREEVNCSYEDVVNVNEALENVVRIYCSAYNEKVSNDDRVSNLFKQLEELPISLDVKKIFWIWSRRFENKKLILAIERRITNDRRRIESGGDEKLKEKQVALLEKCRSLYESMVEVESNYKDFLADRKKFEEMDTWLRTMLHYLHTDTAWRRFNYVSWVYNEICWKRKSTTKLELMSKNLETQVAMLNEFIEDLQMYDVLCHNQCGHK